MTFADNATREKYSQTDARNGLTSKSTDTLNHPNSQGGTQLVFGYTMPIISIYSNYQTFVQLETSLTKVNCQLSSCLL